MPIFFTSIISALNNILQIVKEQLPRQGSNLGKQAQNLLFYQLNYRVKCQMI